jgi:hypothetical protein
MICYKGNRGGWCSTGYEMKLRKLLVGGSVAVALIIGMFCIFALEPFPIPFNADTWRTCTDHSQRFAIHDDRVRKHKRIGSYNVFSM